MASGREESVWAIYFNPGSIPFWGVHVAAVVGVILLGFSWSGLAMAVAFYFGRMFFVCAGYHRYFSHRSFKTSRWFQFGLALGAQSCLQRSVMWWAERHRRHHRFSDTPDDVHSAARDGFWWSHVGWSTSVHSSGCNYENVPDLARFPELRFLNRVKHVPAVLLAIALYVIGGAHALVWGFFVSTVLLWHGTFTINSLSHMFGKRRYATTDDSRNNWLLAIVTMGEGWHNNHHHYMNSARQGFFWWEVDLSYYALLVLERLGLIWDLHQVPAHIRDGVPRRARPPVPAPAET